MKRFVIICIFFAIPIVMAAILAELMLRQVPNPYKYKYDWMQQHAEEVETLVFGSSHTYYGIKPSLLDGNAFSLANVSQPWILDKYLLFYWADRYEKLHTIIWPISYFSWTSSGRLEDGSESYRCRFYKIYMDCDLYSDFSKYNFELSDFRTARGKLDKVYSRNFEVIDSGFDAYGWGSDYKLSGKNVRAWVDGSEAEAAIKRHTTKKYDFVKSNMDLVSEVADFCHQHGIRLVLVTMPCWHSYTYNLNDAQLKHMYEQTRRFQQKYQLLYLDYLKDPRFVEVDFYDSNHLSDVGAEKFSKLLNQDLRNSERVAPEPLGKIKQCGIFGE